MCFPKSPPPAVPLPPQNRKTPITIISVWDQNLDSEFAAIRSLITDFPNISMDTEFPGIVLMTPMASMAPRTVNGSPILEPAVAYEVIKMNVDCLNLIQIGLTLTDDGGNLPERGGPGGGPCIWQFNFRDFDSERDRHAEASIEMLRQSGIDFERNRAFGIDSRRFAELMMSSGLVCSDSVSWVTFHGTYDFGYLVKALTQRPLPGELSEFLNLLRIFFGPRVYDLKHVMKFCAASLRGGLERVSRTLKVDRLAGQSHQAGSDSLLTWHAFQRLRDLYFSETGLEKYAGVLYGLDIS